ncbi:PIG-L deacetylase family protein [Clostridium sp. Cult3]|uniref:PIG-L deacetylase family protein n=1 Tax=Clostridium sp. Cult3 TaxID=2079004 RepID=UPI001F2F1551|nr:PIG-L family deacetylase [Clostridium sp. Cult3]MCF6460446.1 hypothetical protein [Clostridium sp. Cult3]
MLKKIIKIILKYPIMLVNNIYTYHYYKKSSNNENYEIDDMIGKDERIVVFSPHVDDETIGLGATILKHKKANHQMTLVYLTDGGGSTSNLSREDLIQSRRKEGEKVKDIYGFHRVYFLDQIDGNLDSSKDELISTIANLLSEEKPTIIYTPFLLDGHRDHVETTRSIMKALKIWNRDFDKIYMYEVNCPIAPELVNSISIMDEKLYDEKGHMYHIFDSQWAMDFNAFRLLDRRKRYIANRGYGAEIFVKVDLDILIQIEKALEEQGFKPEEFRQLSSRYNLLFAFRTNRGLKEDYNRQVKNILQVDLQNNK